MRRILNKQCTHKPFDLYCQIDKEDYKVSGIVDSISGTVITSEIFGTKPDGWFKAGEIFVGDENRAIKSHTGNNIVIESAIPGLAVGVSFDAYAGCDGSPDTCLNRFDNKINFGGEEFLPTRNPYLCETGILEKTTPGAMDYSQSTQIDSWQKPSETN